MARPGFFKRVKNFFNKVKNKIKPIVKKVINVVPKVMDKLAPVVDVATKFIPYGDVVDKVYDGVQKGFEITNKFVNKGSREFRNQINEGRQAIQRASERFRGAGGTRSGF